MSLSQRNQRVINEHYSLVPKNSVPRATFRRPFEFKFTCEAGYLIPILCDEVLPGDVHTANVTIFARLADLIFPLMDNVTIETQFFFVPMRLVWANSRKFWGEQDNPGDSISYIIPTVDVSAAAAVKCSIWDYFGIPGENMLAADKTINVLPFRAYNRIWNEWYRDQNLQNSVAAETDDGPDTHIQYELLRRNKKHDYFTSALPAPQKGNTAISLPLGTQAPVKGIGIAPNALADGTSTNVNVYETSGSGVFIDAMGVQDIGVPNIYVKTRTELGPAQYPQIYADLSAATAATIAQLRLAVQTQKLLETDARSGTRYTEQLRARWGVTPQDARLQRPEYIGGGVTTVNTTAIAKTAEDGASPLGSLAGQATAGGQHRFTCIGYEHGYIIGLLSVMTKPSYQQGIPRLFTRSTRYDFATPEFAALGEQAIRNDEIYATGGPNDTLTFGYQERYGEYRFSYNRIAGMFRSTVTGNIDEWHLAQEFISLPTLGNTFIQENAPFDRVFAAGDEASTTQALIDMVFDVKSTRPLPAYGIPGGLKGTF